MKFNLFCRNVAPNVARARPHQRSCTHTHTHMRATAKNSINLRQRFNDVKWQRSCHMLGVESSARQCCREYCFDVCVCPCICFEHTLTHRVGTQQRAKSIKPADAQRARDRLELARACFEILSRILYDTLGSINKTAHFAFRTATATATDRPRGHKHTSAIQCRTQI